MHRINELVSGNIPARSSSGICSKIRKISRLTRLTKSSLLFTEGDNQGIVFNRERQARPPRYNIIERFTKSAVSPQHILFAIDHIPRHTP